MSAAELPLLTASTASAGDILEVNDNTAAPMPPPTKDEFACCSHENEQEEQVCRVCHESSGILYHPCKCDGSIRYVHQDCLTTWLKVSRQSQTESKCELCGSKFIFRSLYKHGGTEPPSLSVLEFFCGLLPKITSFMHDLITVSIMTLLWFFCLPIIVMRCMNISLMLVMSGGEAAATSMSHLMSAPSIMQLAASWWNGLLTTLFIAFASASMLQFMAALQQEFLRVDRVQHGAAPQVFQAGAGVGEGVGEGAGVGVGMAGGAIAPRSDGPGTAEFSAEAAMEEAAGLEAEAEQMGRRGPGAVSTGPRKDTVTSHWGRRGPGPSAEDVAGSEPGRESVSDEEEVGDDEDDEEQGEGEEIIEGEREVESAEAEGGGGEPGGAVGEPFAAPANPAAPALADDPAPLLRAGDAAPPGGLDLLNMNDIAVLNGPVELTLNRWLCVAVYNAVFILFFHATPILVGRAVLSYVGLPAGLEAAIVQWVSVQLHANRQHADDLHVHFFGGPLPSSELTTEYLTPRLLALVHSIVGFGFLISTAFVGVAIYIVIWHRSTVTKIAEVVDGQVRALWVTVRTWVVVSSVLFYDGGVLPQMLGWLIGVATLKVFDTSLQDRLELCSTIPLICAIAHWLAGVFFIMHLNVIVSELRGMLRPDLMQDILPDLQARDLEDLGLDHIANHPIGSLVRRAVVSTCVYLPAVVFAVLVPARLGHLVSPCGRPLKLHFNEVMFDVQLPMEMLVFHILVPIVLEGMRHRTLVRVCLESFMRTGCCLLHIEEILDERVRVHARVNEQPQHLHLNNNLAHPILNHGAAQLNLHGPPVVRARSPEDQWLHALLSSEQYSSAGHEDASPSPGGAGSTLAPPLVHRWSIDDVPFSARCVVLLVLGVMGLSLLSSWLVHVPLIVGKRVLVLMHLSIQHDLYSLAAGMCVCWALVASAQYVARDFLSNKDLFSLMRAARKWTWVGVKIVVLGVLWLSIPPLLTGMLLESIAVIPIKTPLTETPRYPLVQCWAVGLVMLKIWTRCLLMGALGDNIYRARIERVLQQGAAGIDAYYVMTSIIFPITIALADKLIIPYFFARVLGAALTNSYALQTALIRYSFLAYFLLLVVVHACSHVHRHLVLVYNEIRDSRYLIGTELANTGVIRGSRGSVPEPEAH